MILEPLKGYLVNLQSLEPKQKLQSMGQTDNKRKIRGASPVEMFNFIIPFLNDHRGQGFNSEQIIREYCKYIGVVIPDYENARAYSEYSNPLKKTNTLLKRLDAYFAFSEGEGFFSTNSNILQGRSTYQYPPSLDYDLKDIVCLGNKASADDNMTILLEESLGMVHPLFPLYLGLLPKRDDKPVIEFEQCDYRNNIYLPVLYDAIVTRHMVTFDYRSFDKPAANVTFSPYYLKEYNRRWFVYGHTEKSTSDASRERYSLDRIKNLHKIQSPLAPKPQKDYATLSKDLIGVSDSDCEKPVDIIIETLNPKIHGLIVSKPFHSSQKELGPFHEDRKKGYPHGTITLHIRPTPEMYGRILYYSDGVKVVEPSLITENIQAKIHSISLCYTY